MPNHPKTVPIEGFKGLNNVLRPERTPQEYLKKALNINLDKQGNISKRKGYTLEDTGDYSCIWANKDGTQCYGVKDGNLVSVDYSFNTTTLQAGLGPEVVSFEEINNIIYLTSPTFKGIIENRVLRTWGLEVPISVPAPSEVLGTLLKGAYQVSYTYMDSEGRESGLSKATAITVSDGTGIQITVPTSTDSRVTFGNIYCSTRDGVILYYVTTVPVGDTYTITSDASFNTPLSTFNLSPAPYGELTTYYRGRIYVVVGNVLYFSNVNKYEYFSLDTDYVELPDKILAIMPVEDGIWIASDNMYYLSGTSPDKFKLTLKERIQVVPGTAKYFSGSYILLENTPIGYKWLITADLGIFVLFNQGVIMNLTATNLSLERGEKGTSVFLQDEGINQYLSIIKKSGAPNNSVVGDTVTTSVIRNGINIG